MEENGAGPSGGGGGERSNIEVRVKRAGPSGLGDLEVTEYIAPGAYEGKSVQLCGTAFESERLRHFPFMDIFSSGA